MEVERKERHLQAVCCKTGNEAGDTVTEGGKERGHHPPDSRPALVTGDLCFFSQGLSLLPSVSQL